MLNASRTSQRILLHPRPFQRRPISGHSYPFIFPLQNSEEGIFWTWYFGRMASKNGLCQTPIRVCPLPYTPHDLSPGTKSSSEIMFNLHRGEKKPRWVSHANRVRVLLINSTALHSKRGECDSTPQGGLENALCVPKARRTISARPALVLNYFNCSLVMPRCWSTPLGCVLSQGVVN